VAEESKSAHVERARRRVGTVLRDKWQIQKLLGVGGMAAVYSAQHRNGKRAALKILHPEYCAQHQFVSRFLREGYVANKIEHPASVAILDDEVCEDGSVFLVMELLEGTSLDRFTRRGDTKRLPLGRVLAVADAVLDLLTVAHAQGIIHRDLKPANIFLTANDQVKVLDFGIARLAETALDGSATQTGAAMGTPAYMPPEQARGRWNLVGARTDLWALGATTFALIAGDRPRRAETVQEELLLAMTTPLPSLATVAPSCPFEVVAWVDRAVAYEIDSRWPDSGTMQRALRAITENADPTSSFAITKGIRDSTKPPNDVGVRADSPSQPSAPHPDTAPVLVEGRDRVEPPTHFTSGGTMGGPHAPPRRSLMWAVVASLATAGLLSGGFLVLSHSRPSAHADAPKASLAAPPPPPPPPTVEEATPPPTGTPPLPPSTPTTVGTGAIPTVSAREALPSAQRPKAAPSPRAPIPATTPGSKSRAPAAPTANPLDERF
jgi:eukaryotic-like serine/threonine-protein kinase